MSHQVLWSTPLDELTLRSAVHLGVICRVNPPWLMQPNFAPWHTLQLETLPDFEDVELQVRRTAFVQESEARLRLTENVEDRAALLRQLTLVANAAERAGRDALEFYVRCQELTGTINSALAQFEMVDAIVQAVLQAHDFAAATLLLNRITQVLAVAGLNACETLARALAQLRAGMQFKSSLGASSEQWAGLLDGLAETHLVNVPPKPRHWLRTYRAHTLAELRRLQGPDGAERRRVLLELLAGFKERSGGDLEYAIALSAGVATAISEIGYSDAWEVGWFLHELAYPTLDVGQGRYYYTNVTSHLVQRVQAGLIQQGLLERWIAAYSAYLSNESEAALAWHFGACLVAIGTVHDDPPAEKRAKELVHQLQARFWKSAEGLLRYCAIALGSGVSGPSGRPGLAEVFR